MTSQHWDNELMRLHKRFGPVLSSFSKGMRSDPVPDIIRREINGMPCAVCGFRQNERASLTVGRMTHPPNLAMVTCAHIMKSSSSANKLGVSFASLSNFIPLCGNLFQYPSCHHAFDTGQLAFCPTENQGEYRVVTSPVYNYLRRTVQLPTANPIALEAHYAFAVVNHHVTVHDDEAKIAQEVSPIEALVRSAMSQIGSSTPLSQTVSEASGQTFRAVALAQPIPDVSHAVIAHADELASALLRSDDSGRLVCTKRMKTCPVIHGGASLVTRAIPGVARVSASLPYVAEEFTALTSDRAADVFRACHADRQPLITIKAQLTHRETQVSYVVGVAPCDPRNLFPVSFVDVPVADDDAKQQENTGGGVLLMCPSIDCDFVIPKHRLLMTASGKNGPCPSAVFTHIRAMYDPAVPTNAVPTEWPAATASALSTLGFDVSWFEFEYGFTWPIHGHITLRSTERRRMALGAADDLSHRIELLSLPVTLERFVDVMRHFSADIDRAQSGRFDPVMWQDLLIKSRPRRAAESAANTHTAQFIFPLRSGTVNAYKADGTSVDCVLPSVSWNMPLNLSRFNKIFIAKMEAHLALDLSLRYSPIGPPVCVLPVFRDPPVDSYVIGLHEEGHPSWCSHVITIDPSTKSQSSQIEECPMTAAERIWCIFFEPSTLDAVIVIHRAGLVQIDAAKVATLKSFCAAIAGVDSSAEKSGQKRCSVDATPSMCNGGGVGSSGVSREGAPLNGGNESVTIDVGRTSKLVPVAIWRRSTQLTWIRPPNVLQHHSFSLLWQRSEDSRVTPYPPNVLSNPAIEVHVEGDRWASSRDAAISVVSPLSKWSLKHTLGTAAMISAVASKTAIIDIFLLPTEPKCLTFGPQDQAARLCAELMPEIKEELSRRIALRGYMRSGDVLEVVVGSTALVCQYRIQTNINIRLSDYIVAHVEDRTTQKEITATKDARKALANVGKRLISLGTELGSRGSLAIDAETAELFESFEKIGSQDVKNGWTYEWVTALDVGASTAGNRTVTTRCRLRCSNDKDIALSSAMWQGLLQSSGHESETTTFADRVKLCADPTHANDVARGLHVLTGQDGMFAAADVASQHTRAKKSLHDAGLFLAADDIWVNMRDPGAPDDPNTVTTLRYWASSCVSLHPSSGAAVQGSPVFGLLSSMSFSVGGLPNILEAWLPRGSPALFAAAADVRRILMLPEEDSGMGQELVARSWLDGSEIAARFEPLILPHAPLVCCRMIPAQTPVRMKSIPAVPLGYAVEDACDLQGRVHSSVAARGLAPIFTRSAGEFAGFMAPNRVRHWASHFIQRAVNEQPAVALKRFLKR